MKKLLYITLLVSFVSLRASQWHGLDDLPEGGPSYEHVWVQMPNARYYALKLTSFDDFDKTIRQVLGADSLDDLQFHFDSDLVEEQQRLMDLKHEMMGYSVLYGEPLKLLNVHGEEELVGLSLSSSIDEDTEFEAETEPEVIDLTGEALEEEQS